MYLRAFGAPCIRRLSEQGDCCGPSLAQRTQHRTHHRVQEVGTLHRAENPQLNGRRRRGQCHWRLRRALLGNRPASASNLCSDPTKPLRFWLNAIRGGSSDAGGDAGIGPVLSDFDDDSVYTCSLTWHGHAVEHPRDRGKRKGKHAGVVAVRECVAERVTGVLWSVLRSVCEALRGFAEFEYYRGLSV